MANATGEVSRNSFIPVDDKDRQATNFEKFREEHFRCSAPLSLFQLGGVLAHFLGTGFMSAFSERDISKVENIGLFFTAGVCLFLGWFLNRVYHYYEQDERELRVLCNLGLGHLAQKTDSYFDLFLSLMGCSRYKLLSDGIESEEEKTEYSHCCVSMDEDPELQVLRQAVKLAETYVTRARLASAGPAVLLPSLSLQKLPHSEAISVAVLCFVGLSLLVLLFQSRKVVHANESLTRRVNEVAQKVREHPHSTEEQKLVQIDLTII
ncbi:MAG: hypothetical protein AAGF04_04880 [Chlamydiota bacterium]